MAESILSCVGHDGTASLANRDFSRVLRANQQKAVFSGAAKSADDAAIARYFAVLKGVSPEIGTRWRSEVNSNCRYRFLNCQTTNSWSRVVPLDMIILGVIDCQKLTRVFIAK